MATAAVKITCAHCGERIVPVYGLPSAEWGHPRATEPPVVGCGDGEHRATPDYGPIRDAIQAEVARMRYEESAVTSWLAGVALPEALTDCALTGTGWIRLTRLESGQVVVGRADPRDVSVIARPR